MSDTESAAGPPRRKVVDTGFLILLGVTLAAALAVAARDGLPHMLGIALGALGFLAVLLPKIAAGLFIAAAIPVLIPREKIARWIGRDSGVGGLVFATAAGALLPGGPSMIFPLTASILGSGADLAAAFAFVTGWSLFNLNRTLIWELSFLPADLVALRILFCLPLPVLLGLAVRGLTRP